MTEPNYGFVSCDSGISRRDFYCGEPMCWVSTSFHSFVAQWARVTLVDSGSHPHVLVVVACSLRDRSAFARESVDLSSLRGRMIASMDRARGGAYSAGGLLRLRNRPTTRTCTNLSTFSLIVTSNQPNRKPSGTILNRNNRNPNSIRSFLLLSGFVCYDSGNPSGIPTRSEAGYD